MKYALQGPYFIGANEEQDWYINLALLALREPGTDPEREQSPLPPMPAFALAITQS